MKLFKVSTGLKEVTVLAENEEKAKEIAGLSVLYLFTGNFQVREVQLPEV